METSKEVGIPGHGLTSWPVEGPVWVAEWNVVLRRGCPQFAPRCYEVQGQFWSEVFPRHLGVPSDQVYKCSGDNPIRCNMPRCDTVEESVKLKVNVVWICVRIEDLNLLNNHFHNLLVTIDSPLRIFSLPVNFETFYCLLSRKIANDHLTMKLVILQPNNTLRKKVVSEPFNNNSLKHNSVQTNVS